MITMTTYQSALRQRVLHLAAWRSLSTLAREMQMSRNTLSAWLAERGTQNLTVRTLQKIETWCATQEAAGQAAVPPPPPVPPASTPTDMQTLIQQAVQQALAAQAAARKDQLAAPSQASDPTPPASQDGWCARHQVAMERRSNAKGSWCSHWLADENR